MKAQFAIILICVLLGVFYGCSSIGPGFSLGIGYGAAIGVLMALLYEILGAKK